MTAIPYKYLSERFGLLIDRQTLKQITTDDIIEIIYLLECIDSEIIKLDNQDTVSSNSLKLMGYDLYRMREAIFG
jgi:hypothetical protein